MDGFHAVVSPEGGTTAPFSPHQEIGKHRGEVSDPPPPPLPPLFQPMRRLSSDSLADDVVSPSRRACETIGRPQGVEGVSWGAGIRREVDSGTHDHDADVI